MGLILFLHLELNNIRLIFFVAPDKNPWECGMCVDEVPSKQGKSLNICENPVIQNQVAFPVLPE